MIKYSAGKLLKGSLVVMLMFPLWAMGSQTDLVRLLDLSGKWKFSIGDREEWYEPAYNDEKWESIHVPSTWEDQGFYGYNGYAVYRKQFVVSSAHKEKTLFLVLGYIDDVDETYLNGKKIGSAGSFPPNFTTAYNAERIYMVPSDLLNYDGKNTVVVKVYDTYLGGGIVSGSIGLYSSRFDLQPEINLSGSWKFKIGDDPGRKDPMYNDGSWDEIFVPAKWEDQGYRDYDGFAWYRKSFYYKGQFTDSRVVLVMGKIDDFDEVYVNGHLVGGTGQISTRGHISTGDQYQAFRGYYFSSALLEKGKKNTIAVRVYDGTGVGGIYEGPVGIISQERYIRFWRSKKNNF
jgi:sialate O-acetylesterase